MGGRDRGDVLMYGFHQKGKKHEYTQGIYTKRRTESMLGGATFRGTTSSSGPFPLVQKTKRYFPKPPFPYNWSNQTPLKIDSKHTV
ncbi:hypothetical protein FKM82_028121 [Ascaphus truei]